MCAKQSIGLNMKVSLLLEKIKLPQQILLMILLISLVSFYFSIPYLDKHNSTDVNECKSEGDNVNNNYYQTGEFNIKDPKHCKKSPQWPMLPTDK